MQPRQVGTDFFPGPAAIPRAHDELIGVIERFIGQGKDLWQRPSLAIWIVGIEGRQLSAQRHGDIQLLIAAPRAAAVQNIAVLWIGNHGIALARQTGGFPIAKRKYAFARPGADAHAAAILLCSVQPIGKTVVGGDVINLRRGLVVPGAPALAAIHANDSSLIAAEHHAIAILRIHPELVIIVTAGRSFDRNERFAAVGGHICCGVDDVSPVGIFGIHADLFEIPAAAPQPVL